MKIQPLILNTPINFKNRKASKTSSIKPSNIETRLVDNSGRLNEIYKNYFLLNAIGNRQIFYKLIFASGRLKKEELDQFDSSTRNDLLKRAKSFLKIGYSTRHKVEPKVFAKAAKCLKNYFDKTYGAGQYRIISLGTSPAVAAQAMEYLGVETKYVPVSGIHEDNVVQSNQKDTDYYLNKPNMDIILGYIESLGFKKDDKMNVVLDYTISRKTLDTMIECMKRRFDLDDSDIKGYDVVDVIDCLVDKKDNTLTENEFENFTSMMAYQEIEAICSVPHFYIDDSINLVSRHACSSFLAKDNAVFDKFNKYSTPVSRAFSLVLLDEVDKIQKKEQRKNTKKNPKAKPQD